jgi:hypothetical protein
VLTYRARESSPAERLSRHRFQNGNRAWRVLIVSAFCVVAAGLACAQDEAASADNEVSVERKAPVNEPVESEIAVQGLASYGNYRIFAAGWDQKLYIGEVEYYRHTWGWFLHARLDYTAGVLPLMLLDKPRVVVPGVGIEPIGVRFQWFSNRKWKPYLTCKGGMIVFDKKVPNAEASYESFSMEQSFGVQVKMTPRVDLRLGLFGDFHFSNAYITPINPGLDVMNANVAISYQLGKPRLSGAN